VARLRETTGHDITVQPLGLDPSDPTSIEAGVAHLRESRNGKVKLLDYVSTSSNRSKCSQTSALACRHCLLTIHVSSASLECIMGRLECW
jgi:hypothetical protein